MAPWHHVRGAHCPGISTLIPNIHRKMLWFSMHSIFWRIWMQILFKGKLVLSGGRYETTELWKLPIRPIYRKNHQNKYNQLVASLDLQLTPQQQAMNAANYLYTLPYKQNQLKYMHQLFFNSPFQILTDAAFNNQLTDIPFIHNMDFILKYIAPSPATPKGRMKRPRSGIRSTRKR